MYYTSNKRKHFSLSAGIFNTENEHGSTKEYKKMFVLNFYFSIVHISTNNVIGCLKLCMHVRNIAVEGTVSQISFLNLSFYFISKNG